MAKAAKSTSGTAAKKTAAAKKTTSRARKSPAKKKATPTNDPSVHESILALQQRLVTLEEKISQGFTTLIAEVGELRSAVSVDPPQSEDTGVTQEALEALLQQALQKNFGEQMEPINTLLRRVEERVGFIGNRLKSSGGSQGRNKSWRRDQSSNSRSKGQNSPRQGQGQGQNWAPPSAASVQGHFAPRPMSRDHLAGPEDDE